METNFKGTKGKAYAYQNLTGPYFGSRLLIQSKGIGSDNHEVACAAGKNIEEAEANAQLIADAFNVRQQINVDLPELLEQRNELLEAVKEAKRVICSMKLSMWVHPDCSQDSEFYDMATTGEETEDKLEDLITKIEQK